MYLNRPKEWIGQENKLRRPSLKEKIWSAELERCPAVFRPIEIRPKERTTRSQTWAFFV
jgi:hypothetical protein